VRLSVADFSATLSDGMHGPARHRASIPPWWLTHSSSHSLPATSEGPSLLVRQPVLKLLFVRDDLMSPYDFDVIGEWSESFQRTGTNGIQPDVLTRMKLCQQEGRPWFREALLVVGRRGGKNYLGAIVGAYVLWRFLGLEDPQAAFGIDPTQRLTGIVFGSKFTQARDVQFRVLQQTIVNAPCFTPLLSRTRADSLTLRSLADIRRAAEPRRGSAPDLDQASFEIVAKESTDTAGRGPTSFMIYLDEGAHMVGTTGASRSMEDVYEAATPSLDQFGTWGFIYIPSSPWQRAGKFWDLYQQALETDPLTGLPTYPEKPMVQLTSWDLYMDWDRTGPGGIAVYPEGRGGSW
jgi:hypothetical protein